MNHSGRELEGLSIIEYVQFILHVAETSAYNCNQYVALWMTWLLRWT